MHPELNQGYAQGDTVFLVGVRPDGEEPGRDFVMLGLVVGDQVMIEGGWALDEGPTQAQLEAEGES